MPVYYEDEALVAKAISLCQHHLEQPGMDRWAKKSWHDRLIRLTQPSPSLIVANKLQRLYDLDTFETRPKIKSRPK